MPPAATSAARPSAPPAMPSATARVVGSGRSAMAIFTGGPAAPGCPASATPTAVRASNGLIMPCPLPVPLLPSAVASIRCLTCAGVSFG